MVPLLKIWATIKKYWSLFALVAGAIAAVVVFRQQGSSFSDDLKRVKDAHDEEIRRIEAAREEERLQHLANEEKLKDTLEAVQRHYDDAKRDLDSKKKAQVEELVKKYNDDPVALAKQLSALTGLTIILPD